MFSVCLSDAAQAQIPLSKADSATPRISLQEPPSAIAQTARLPADFWDTPSRDAAMAFLKTNSHGISGDPILLEWNPSITPPPPGRLTVSLTVHHPRSNPPILEIYYLRSDEVSSYAAASSHAGLSRVALDPAEARHLAEVVYWFDAIRSRQLPKQKTDSFSGRIVFDQLATVILRGSDGTILVDRFGSGAHKRITLSPQGYTDRTAADAITLLLQTVLAPSLGKYARHSPAQREQLAKEFLALASPDERDISMPLAALACWRAVETDMGTAKPLLERIVKFSPPNTEPLPSHAELQKAIRALVQKREPSPSGEDRSQLTNLRILQMEMRAGVSSRDPRLLVRSAATALKQIRGANNPDDLAEWVKSDDHGSWWAFRRLSEIAPDLALDHLEQQLTTASPRQSQTIFERIAAISPERAKALMAKPNMPFAVRFKAAMELPEGKDRDETLVDLLLDYDCSDFQAKTLIPALVPLANPRRAEVPNLDANMIRVITPDRSRRQRDLVSYAATASALRGNLTTLKDIKRILDSRQDQNTSGLLNAWILLADQEQGDVRSQLKSFLVSHLYSTTHSVNELLWAVWAADLVELLPEIERLAAEGHEGTKIETRPSRDAKPVSVQGPFSLARQILALWRPASPETRFRQLLHLGSSEIFRPPDYHHCAGTWRLEKELKAAASNMSPEERKNMLTTIRETPPLGTSPSARIWRETALTVLQVSDTDSL